MSTKNTIDKKKTKTLDLIDNLRKENKKLKEKINNMNQEVKEKDDKIIRLYADLQNNQKRMEKDFSYKEEEIKKKYLSELIDINELLKKAYNDTDPKKGLKLILNNIDNFFSIQDIKYIECLGKKFDHNLHHAITTLEKEDCEDNTIIEEVKKGFMIDKKIFRPSHVIVSKKKEKNEG